jgi:hypothetical protein
VRGWAPCDADADALCWELLISVGAVSMVCGSVDDSTVGCVVVWVSSSAGPALLLAVGVSGTASSGAASGVVGCAVVVSVFGASGPGSGAFPLPHACSCSSPVAGSDMLEDDDISDAEEEGSRGRERRRSFWRLF